MKLNFHNNEYVTPPGSLSQLLSHPYYGDRKSIEIAIFNHHRYAFFFWNKWTQKLFSVPYFESLLKRDIGLNGIQLNVFAERIVNTSSRASYQQLYTIEHSLTKLLDLQSKQSIKISKEDMAAYLGVSVRSLNRGLKNI